ncbi:MAG: SDR family NAD(P)-dependent oxidoreductase [Nocardioidaceae bacterium]
MPTRVVCSSVPRAAAVLITGCSTGIGAATARRLAGSGRPVWATARQVETLTPLQALGCHVARLDVTDEASMRGCVEKIRDVSGPIGGLVNNAGYGEYGPVEEVSMPALRRQFETNVFGLVRMAQLVLPAMREQGHGRIINVSSMGGRMTLPGGGAYHASKYAVEALSDALRFEVRGFGVNVTLVEPGPVWTPFVEDATSSAEGDGPYAAFRVAVAHRNAAAYGGPQARGTSSADDVAQVIERALTARRPRARYLVGPVSRLMVGARTLLPDMWWDGLLRRQYPTP